MSKKRAIVSYDKLSEDMKDRLEDAFPEGFGGGMTQIKTPTGETLDALLWETEEIIYLIKLNKVNKKPVVIPQEDDEEEEDDIDDIEEDEVKVEEAEDVADDEEDDFDEPVDDEEDSDEE
jgi:hypothetical protein